MRTGTGRGTLGEVWDGSEDPRGGSGWVMGPSGRFGTSQGTLGKVLTGRGASMRSGTGWGTLVEVQNG